MKYYVSEVMLCSITIVHANGSQEKVKLDDKVCDGYAGFLPVFSSREKAQAFRPDCGVMVIEVEDVTE